MTNYLKSDQMNVVLNEYNKTQFRVIELKPIPSLSWANPSSAPASFIIQNKLFNEWSIIFEDQIFPSELSVCTQIDSLRKKWLW